MVRIIIFKLLVFVAFVLTSTFILNGQEKFITVDLEASTFFSTRHDKKKETKSDQLRDTNNEIDIFTINRSRNKTKLKIGNA